VHVVSRNANGVEVLCKLIGMPDDDDDEWFSLGEINHNQQEFIIRPQHNRGRGIDFRFQEIGTQDNILLIKKITGFYIPETSRIII